MLLNLMRVEDVDPEYLLRASFHQYQREIEAPGIVAQAEDLEKEAANIETGNPAETELVSQYYAMDQQLLLTRKKITKWMQDPKYVLKFLQAGRLVNVILSDEEYGWGPIVSYKKKQGTGSAGEAGRQAKQSSLQEYTLEVLLRCTDRHFDSTDQKGKDEDADNAGLLWRGTRQSCRPARDTDDKNLVSWRIFTVGLENTERFSAIKIVMPSDCTKKEARNKVGSIMRTAESKFKGDFQLLDPENDLKINDPQFQTLVQRAEALVQRLASHELSTDFEEDRRMMLVGGFEKKSSKLAQAKILREEARNCQTITMKDDMKKMKRVLKKLGHVDGNGVIQTKGRAACEVNTANELVVVDLIFTGAFNDLSVEQCAALLSCMTFDERNKSDEDPASGLKPFLSGPFFKLREVARNVAKVVIACGVEQDEDEFVDQFNPGM